MINRIADCINKILNTVAKFFSPNCSNGHYLPFWRCGFHFREIVTAADFDFSQLHPSPNSHLSEDTRVNMRRPKMSQELHASAVTLRVDDTLLWS